MKNPISTTKWTHVAAFGMLSVAACGRGSPAPGGAVSGSVPPTPTDLPETVAISAMSIESGFAGDIRHDSHVSIAAFRIAKRPVTVSQYRQCVSAGACTEPASKAHVCTAWNAPYDLNPSPYGEFLDRPTYDVSDDLPVTCVQHAQATQYCVWVGGQLPTLPQWLAAARGQKATRYSWGDTAPTCLQSPAGRGDRTGVACRGEGDDKTAQIARSSVGRHRAGEAPSGVEDVLLTRGELLNRSDDADVNACASWPVGCKVASDRFGSIAWAEPIPSTAYDEGPNRSDVAAGFRCAFAAAP
jgi:formylglycine-generating enzyme required for sulfatase activity